METGSAEEGGGSPAGSCRIMYTHLWLQATNLRKPTCHRQTNKPTYRSQPTTTPTYSVVVVAGRLACSGAAICPKCWPFMNIAIRIVDTALRGALLVAPGLFVQNGCKCTRIQRLLNSLAKAPVGQVGQGCYQPRALAAHPHHPQPVPPSRLISMHPHPSFVVSWPSHRLPSYPSIIPPSYVSVLHTHRGFWVPEHAVGIFRAARCPLLGCRQARPHAVAGIYVACPPVKGELPPSSSPTQCCGIPLYILS